MHIDKMDAYFQSPKDATDKMKSWFDSPSKWLCSAPSDEITVNEATGNEGEDKDQTWPFHQPLPSPLSQHEASLKSQHAQPHQQPQEDDSLERVEHARDKTEMTRLNVEINALGSVPIVATPTPNQFGGTERTPEFQSSAAITLASPSHQPPSEPIITALFPLWTKFTDFIHRLITRIVVTSAVHAARNPKSYIIGITLLSFVLIATGFSTNFSINTDEQVIYAPFKSKAKEHADWIDNESGFPGSVRIFTVNIHSGGDNVLGYEQMRQVFDVLDEVRNTPGYDHICEQGDYVNFDDITTCRIMSFTRFFKHDAAGLDNLYEEAGEAAVIEAISADSYENQTPVDDNILGNAQRDENGTLAYVESYMIYFFIPKIDDADALEDRLLANLFQMRQSWQAKENSLELEFFAMRSYSDEFARAIENDLILLPFAFFLMSGFSCLVFCKWDRVKSRTSLGVGSVVTIVFSLMSSFGLMFTIGVPFTSMTQILPFVVFGVGLDDTFIITGAYFRTDPKKDPVERVRETMEEVGLSISVTTITTMVAFALGAISTIPAIYWLNLYAFPTIMIDFVFQITFFVALLVLDERRLQENRMDCCPCVKVKIKTEDRAEDVATENQAPEKSAQERFMAWYAHQLLRPSVKAIVVVVFLAYAAVCAYSTTMLTQEFDFADLLPTDSYVKDFLFSMETYTERVLGIGIYFRGDFDQMHPDIIQQMIDYVDELSALPQTAAEPPFCWFRDFQNFQNSSLAIHAGTDNMTLQEQIDFAFSVDAIQETYGRHVVRNEYGIITSSRCYTYLENVDLGVVEQQIDFLNAQRAITARQPINQGTNDWSFFTFDQLYFIWEFYAIAVEELIFTTISGVIAVCSIGFFFFPHWQAIFFTFPLISMLYINLLGTLQLAGLHVNAVTYVCLVISIGLMVDFIIHVLLRYYESKEQTREAKVHDTLETMGASILVGGISTTLGVLPMSLSTSEIMNTVFISFFVMIVLGVTHGLIFLPVMLSIFGPTTNFMNPLEGTNDLALKVNGDSDTDESSDDDDGAAKRTASVELSKNNRVVKKPSHKSATSQDYRYRTDEVLHSKTTFREESLEVVQWRTTMAWI